jgi:hypothetical protein
VTASTAATGTDIAELGRSQQKRIEGMHLVALSLWQRLSDIIELRRLRRRLPSAHRAWSVTSGKQRPETDTEYLARLRALARERAQWRDKKVAIAPSDNDPREPAQTPDHEQLARAFASLEEAMVALRARAEMAEKRADAAEADREAAQARADHAAAERDEAKHRADALKVLLDATQVELVALRGLVDVTPHDAQKVREATEGLRRKGGRPRRIAGGEAQRLTVSANAGPIDWTKASVAVQAGTTAAATLARRFGQAVAVHR